MNGLPRLAYFNSNFVKLLGNGKCSQPLMHKNLKETYKKLVFYYLFIYLSELVHVHIFRLLWKKMIYDSATI